MSFTIHANERTAGGRSSPVYTLRHQHQAEIEIWPGHGFNCLTWKILHRGSWHHLLDADPSWEANPVPTRSGIPILFPFPNRIAGGRLSFHDRHYSLPLNDSTKKNAIHGWAPRFGWQVLDQGTNAESAWLTADFLLSRDAPDCLQLWPGDAHLTGTYQLRENGVQLELMVDNRGNSPCPFGLGFHPYFRFPNQETSIDHCRLLAPAQSLWELADSIPTGRVLPVPEALDFNQPRPLSGLELDTLYTDLGTIEPARNGLYHRARLTHTQDPGSLDIWASAQFRESVLFIPAHRRSVCFEPYTCATNAAQLQDQGLNAGWNELRSQETWQARLFFHWNPAGNFET